MKKCVVIIPALNEEKTIGTVIDAIPKTLFDSNVSLEVIVINDGSNDSTAAITKAHGATVIDHETPLGVGVSFADGVREALRRGADYAVNIDADGQMNPKDIEKLLLPVCEGEADMVTASRFMDKAKTPNMPAIKRWGNDKVARIISSIVGKRYYDVSCGFRAYNREALLRLNLFGSFTYTQETFISLAGCSHIRIREVPVVIRGEREYGTSRVASSILKYAVRSGAIILSAFKDYRPKKFFGGGALICFVLGGGFELIMFIYYFRTGHFSDYIWAGLIGAFLAIIAMVFLILMIVSDTLGKIKTTEEAILYLNKKREYYGSNEQEV